MFISKAEKETIIETLGIMSAQISTLRRDVYDLKLAAGMTKPVKVDGRKRVWSDDVRKEHSERMKKLWADRKAKKAAV
jgi:hypothetical protein